MNLPDPQPSIPVALDHDRRHHPRYTVRVQIALYLDGSDVPMASRPRPKSRRLFYVQVLMALPLAAHVQATLWLADVPINIRGRVVTRHPQYGNGIMFLDFEGEGEQLLKHYLEAITT